MQAAAVTTQHTSWSWSLNNVVKQKTGAAHFRLGTLQTSLKTGRTWRPCVEVRREVAFGWCRVCGVCIYVFDWKSPPLDSTGSVDTNGPHHLSHTVKTCHHGEIPLGRKLCVQFVQWVYNSVLWRNTHTQKYFCKETLKETMFNSLWAMRDINQNDFLHQHAGQYEEVLCNRWVCVCLGTCVFVCIRCLCLQIGVRTIRPKICNLGVHVS